MSISLFRGALLSIGFAAFSAAGTPASEVLAAPHATTVTLTAVADAHIANIAPRQNFGGQSTLFAGRICPGFETADFPTQEGAYHRALIRFDLSALPAGASIRSATLRLYRNGSRDQGPTASILRVLESWQESRVTFANFSGATAPPRSTIQIGSSSRWISWNVTELAQGWVDGSFANHGLMLRSDNENAGCQWEFASREVPRDHRDGYVQLVLVYDTAPPDVRVWFVEGCDRSYEFGDTVNIRFSTNVSGVVELKHQPSGNTVVPARRAEAGQVYRLTPTQVGGPAGAHSLNIRLLDPPAQGRCDYTVVVPSATPTSTSTPSATPTESATPTPTETPSATPTPSKTDDPTSTSTPSFTNTPTSTMTPTRDPRLIDLSGSIVLERRFQGDHSGARVCACAGDAEENCGLDEEDSICTETDSLGNWALPEVRPGPLEIRHQSYLRARGMLSPSTTESVELPMLRMLAGDVNQDDLIWDEDLVAIAGAWGQRNGDARWRDQLDITGDGTVDILDAVAIEFNWLRDGPSSIPGAESKLDRRATIADVSGHTTQQTATTLLSAEPAEQELRVGDIGSVEVRVADVEHLFAYNLGLRFDPDVLRVVDIDPSTDGVQIEVGDFLDPFNFIVGINRVDENDGLIELMVTQTHPATGRSGEGALARIDFEALTEGQSTVALETTRLFDDRFPEARQIEVRSADSRIDVVPSHGELANISTRGYVGTGDEVMIGGFIIEDAPVDVILRAIGPDLTGRGVPGALEDPTLQLYDSTGQLVAENDNWVDSPQAAEIEANALKPADPRESMLIATLEPGAFTAIVRGADGRTGIALVEAFKRGGSGVLGNISTRDIVRGGDAVMIGGLIIEQRDTPIIVRAIGPDLANRAVPGVLEDPTLQLFDSTGQLVAENDNWVDSPQAGAIEQHALRPADPRESMLLITLEPGAYTAIVRGSGGRTGIALVEVFRVDPPNGGPDPSPPVADSALPFKGEGLEPGERIYTGDHGSGIQGEGEDFGARRYLGDGAWSPHMEGKNGTDNSDFVIYKQPVYAIDDGTIVGCWRNAPENPSPGPLHPKFDKDNGFIPGGGNMLFVDQPDGRRVLYAHMIPGTISSELCPNNDEYFPKAMSISEGDAFVMLDPADQVEITKGDRLGEVGNSGSSSEPHLHLHAQQSGAAAVMRFEQGRYKPYVNGGTDILGGWQSLSGQEIPDGEVLIRPPRQTPYRMVDFEAYPVAGGIMYSGIFKPGSYGPIALFESDWTKFLVGWQNIETQGYRMKDFEGYRRGETLVYSGIFEPGTYEPMALFKSNWGEFLAGWQTIEDDGYRMKDLEVFSSGDGLTYAGIFEPGAYGPTALFESSWEEFLAGWQTIEDDGYRMKDLEVFSSSDGLTYAGIFEPGEYNPAAVFIKNDWGDFREAWQALE